MMFKKQLETIWGFFHGTIVDACLGKSVTTPWGEFEIDSQNW
jgi:hypothetical protein